MATVSRAAAAEAAIGAMIDDHAAGSRKRRRIGSTEDYELTRVLGKGGFGVVVKARHRASGEDVALKFLVRSPDGSGGGKRKLHRAHALHRDLLREACYLAACRGTRPSSACTASRGTPSPGSAASSWSTSARASPTSWSIVHRDIKPGNVLVGGEGAVKICDLGLAVSMASAPPPRGRAGTLWYMAPEMLLGRPDYDELVDAWSLGCVMAELLTGEPLFPGQNVVDQLLRISGVLGGAGQHRGSRLREMFPEERLSRDGFEVLDGLLRCDPGERLPAAEALQCPWFNGTADVPASAA